LLCFDKGIAALITNNAPIAAEFFMYAKAGINIVAEYKKTFPGSVNASDTVEPLLISEMSSMGGKARYRNSPLYPVEMEVENIWLDWQNRKYLYRSNAEFAQEMMKVYKVLENPRTVTTWCTRWKKESGQSAG